MRRLECKNTELRADNRDRRNSQQSARQELKAVKHELKAKNGEVKSLSRETKSLQQETKSLLNEQSLQQETISKQAEQLASAARALERERKRKRRALESKSTSVASFETAVLGLSTSKERDEKKARDQLFSLISLLRVNHQCEQQEVSHQHKRQKQAFEAAAQGVEADHAVEKSKLEAAAAEKQHSLEEARGEIAGLKGPIQMKKNGRDYADNQMLLTTQLISMGVSETIVGLVQKLCVKELANRELSHTISASTASRMAFRGCELGMHHFGETLVKNSDRGWCFGTDTTTIKGAERAANVVQLKELDPVTGVEIVHLLRVPTVQLPSHTAVEQFENNVQWMFSDARETF